MIDITLFPSGPFQTNALVVSCTIPKQALIVDPAPNSFAPIRRHIKEHNLTATTILLTHSHWDHFADTAKVKATYNIPVLVHRDDAPNLINPGADGLPLPDAIEGVDPDGFLEDGMIISVGESSLRVIHTPGHSPGSVCFYCAEDNIVITGDTLFKGSIGNLSFPTSEASKMWASLEKLIALPPQTNFIPGHGASSQLSKESWLPNAKELFGY